MENTARDVLKLYIENLSLRAYEFLASIVSSIYFSAVPE